VEYVPAVALAAALGRPPLARARRASVGRAFIATGVIVAIMVDVIRLALYGAGRHLGTVAGETGREEAAPGQCPDEEDHRGGGPGGAHAIRRHCIGA
jgi:hypothetical protein